MLSSPSQNLTWPKLWGTHSMEIFKVTLSLTYSVSISWHLSFVPQLLLLRWHDLKVSACFVKHENC
jgi:hypothetical protein